MESVLIENRILAYYELFIVFIVIIITYKLLRIAAGDDLSIDIT